MKVVTFSLAMLLCLSGCIMKAEVQSYQATLKETRKSIDDDHKKYYKNDNNLTPAQKQARDMAHDAYDSLLNKEW